MNLRRSLLVAFLLALLFYGELPPPATATPVQTSLDIPIEVNKKTSHPGPEIQNLYKFIRQIKTGDEDVLAGIYVAGVMALPVIQQPPGEPAYVSTQPDTLTQFALANDYGSMGILAHNTLAGAIFNELHPLQRIRLIFGDGSVTEYVISSVERFQALSPTSPFSDFMDLSHPGQIITSTELFEMVYQSETDQVVFQTCIAEGFESSWGRLFITAVPVSSQSHQAGYPKYIQ